MRQTNLYISQCVELSVVVIQREVNTLSVWQNSLPTIVRAKSFLSPCYIMVYLSTIFSPIHLFTSYSPFLCSKSSYSLLPVIGKKDLSLPLQNWQAETQQDHWERKQGSHYWPGFQVLYHPACGASDIPAKTSEGDYGWRLYHRIIFGNEQKSTLKSTLRRCFYLKPTIIVGRIISLGRIGFVLV